MAGNGLWPTLHDLHDHDAPVCPHCRFELAWVEVPAWVKHGVVFALDGKAYRVVSALPGSSNRPFYPHFVEVVTAEPVDAEPWMGLPKLPATRADIGRSLTALFALPQFTSRDLERALRRVE